MPKQKFHINRFEGGLNTDFAPEDIPDNSFLQALGISVSKIGRVTVSGDVHAASGITAIEVAGDSSTNHAESAGYGMFAFNSDYAANNTEAATNYLCINNGSYVSVWDGSSWNTNVIDMGETSAGMITHNSYYAPNGDLRVCDGNFASDDNDENTPKWFGYTKKKTYGTGTGDAEVKDWNVQDASIEGGYPKNSSGRATCATMADNESPTKGGGSSAYNSTNQKYAYVPGGASDWGLQIGYIPAADSGTGKLSDATWQPNTEVNYKFYASYIYDEIQEGNPTLLTMCPTLRGYSPGKLASEVTGDAAVTSSDSLQFVDRSNDGNDATIDVGIGGFSRSGTTVTCTTRYADATMDIASGDGTVTHDAFTSTGEGILIGQHVSGSGIPSNSVVKSITDATHFELGNSSGSAVNATATTTNVSDGYIGRVHDIAVGDKVIVKGTDNFDGTWTVTAETSSNFTFTHTTSGTINGANTENGYFSKVGTNQAVYFSASVKINHDNSTNFNFGADAIQADGTTSGQTGNKRITGTRVYYSSSDDGHGNLWVIFEANFEKGLKAYGVGIDKPIITDYMPWSNADDNQDDLHIDWDSSNVWKHPPKYETYESLNGYSHSSKLDAKWKTAVIANGRAYIGNVKRREKATFNVNDTALSSGKQAWNGGSSANLLKDPTFGDRILKSPVDRFDTFPEEMAIELFGGDDGDQIVKLETFADRLLVFKKYTLHIINIAKDVEILESSHPGMGLSEARPCQSCLTGTGVAWINSGGAYHYNGQNIESLTDNKIEALWKGQAKSGDNTSFVKFWMSHANDVPSIGYDYDSNKLIIHKTAAYDGSDNEQVLIYDMNLKAWTRIRDGNLNNNSVRSNMVNYNNMLIYHEELSGSSNDPIYKYDDAPDDLASVAENFSIYTKPYDFGTPLQRKKIYKVYITYRCDASDNSEETNINVQYYTNGNKASLYNFTTGASNPFLADDDDGIGADTNTSSIMELDDTNGVWETAALKPLTSSEANKIKSFGLFIGNKAAEAVDANFEINDITIIYRNKGIK